MMVNMFSEVLIGDVFDVQESRNDVFVQVLEASVPVQQQQVRAVRTSSNALTHSNPITGHAAFFAPS